MEIASCVVRLCNFRAPVTVRTSSAVLFTRRGRENGCLCVRIYPSIEGSCNCARDHTDAARSLIAFNYATLLASPSIVGRDRRVHQSSSHCRSHFPIAPVDYAQFTR